MSLLKRIEGQRPQQPEGQPSGDQGRGTGGPGQPPPQGGPLTQSTQPARDGMRDVRIQIQTKIINNLDPRLDLSDAKKVRAEIESMFNRFLDEEGSVVTRVERQRMTEQILDVFHGFMPIHLHLNVVRVNDVKHNV